MKCEIIAAGKVREDFLQQGISMYLKRLQPVFPVQIREIPDQPVPEKASPADITKAVAKEGEAMLAAIDDQTLVVALAINGKAISSEELAAQMNEWSFSGKQRLVFVIGGSCGLAPAVLERADFLLSFGKFTYPHQLMRLILAEQIYRGVKINRNEPYHK